MKAYMINFDTKELEAMELAKDATNIERYILEEASKRKAWEDYIPRVITGDAMSIYRFEEDEEVPEHKKMLYNNWKGANRYFNREISSNSHLKDLMDKYNIETLKFHPYYDAELDNVILATFSKNKYTDEITRIDYRVKMHGVYAEDSRESDNRNMINNQHVSTILEIMIISHGTKRSLDLAEYYEKYHCRTARITNHPSNVYNAFHSLLRGGCIA